MIAASLSAGTSDKPAYEFRWVEFRKQRRDSSGLAIKIVAKTLASHHLITPGSFDCIRVIVFCAGEAVLLGECGTRHVSVGDVVVLAANTLCGVESEGWIATTIITYPRKL